jgi:hypothetical protein
MLELSAILRKAWRFDLVGKYPDQIQAGLQDAREEVRVAMQPLLAVLIVLQRQPQLEWALEVLAQLHEHPEYVFQEAPDVRGEFTWGDDVLVNLPRLKCNCAESRDGVSGLCRHLLRAFMEHGDTIRLTEVLELHGFGPDIGFYDRAVPVLNRMSRARRAAVNLMMAAILLERTGNGKRPRVRAVLKAVQLTEQSENLVTEGGHMWLSGALGLGHLVDLSTLTCRCGYSPCEITVLVIITQLLS